MSSTSENYPVDALRSHGGTVGTLSSLTADSVVAAESNEQVEAALAEHSVDEVAQVIEAIIAEKSVSREDRRQAVSRVVLNQPHPMREFRRFKLWDNYAREISDFNESVRTLWFTVPASFLYSIMVMASWLMMEDISNGMIVLHLGLLLGLLIVALSPVGVGWAGLLKYGHQREDMTLEERKEAQRADEVDRFIREQQRHQEELAEIGVPEAIGPTVSGVKQDFADAQARIASYELDMEKALSRPAFNDMSVEAVSEMVLQLRKCRRMVDEMSAATVSQAADEVDGLWMKIGTAEAVAKKIAWSQVSAQEQKDLKMALDLVRQANDPGNPEELRRNLYARLKKVVARLDAGGVTIPAKMTEQIERRASPELTELNPHSEAGMDSVPTPASR